VSFLHRVVWIAVVPLVVAALAVLLAALSGTVHDLVLALVGFAIVIAVLATRSEESR
jgi:hypothetical protein